jgi:hypothetical protein
VLAAIVNRDRVTDHVGNNRRTSGPGLDNPFLVLRVQVVDLLEKMVIDERALLETARH